MAEPRVFFMNVGWMTAYQGLKGDTISGGGTGRPYHQEQIQKTHLRHAGELSGISPRIGWNTFRHSYRSWLDDTGAPMTVQKELMRHASIQTTMNVYGRAMTETKRKAHGKIVEMRLKPSVSSQTCIPEAVDAVVGVNGSLLFAGFARN